MRKAYTVILFLLAFTNPVFAQNKLTFERITGEDGLSSDAIFDIAQDQYGFMWFATSNGLNRWDGHNMLVIKHDSANEQSISSNKIYALLIDSRNRFWVGTGRGLNLFDPLTFTARHFRHDSLDVRSISGDRVHALYEDNHGRIWVTTRGCECKLNLLDTTNWTFTRYCHQPGNSASINPYSTGIIQQDATGRYWVGTWLDEVGIDTFRLETNTFHNVPFKGHDKRRGDLSPELVNNMYRDSENNIWFATYLGLYVYRYDDKQWVNYSKELKEAGSIQPIVENEDGSLWIGGFGTGLHRFFPQTGKLITYRSSDSEESLSSDVINVLYKDRQGALWIGTKGGGVSKLDPFNNQFNLLTFETQNGKLNIGTGTIVEDNQGLLWADATNGVLYNGGIRAGYVTYNSQTNTYRHFEDNPPDVSRLSIPDSTIYISTLNSLLRMNGNKPTPLVKADKNILLKSIFFDPADSTQLWIATTPGLLRMSMQTGEITKFIFLPFHSSGVPNYLLRITTFSGYEHFFSVTKFNSFISSAYQDSRNTIWMIIKNIENTNVASIYTFAPGDTAMQPFFPNQEWQPLSIYEDKHETIWISSYTGLYQYNRNNNQLDSYTRANGLASDSVFAVMEDKQSFLWLFHAKGISKFDQKNREFTHFHTNNNFPTNQIRPGEKNYYYSTVSGKMYYGVWDGIISFTPERIKNNTMPPPVFITAFKTFGEDHLLDTAVFAKKHIELKYTNNFFSFGFSALNYSNHELNRYEYLLENYNRQWVKTTTPEAHYTKVPSGNYVFKVRGCNDKGVWSQQVAQIHITILPPWWLTWWAKTLWVLIPVVVLLSVYFMRINSLKRQQQHLEDEVRKRTAEVEQQKEEILAQAEQLKQQNDEIQTQSRELQKQNEKLREMDQFKQNMTGMIVHDLKNPLNTIINAPENYVDRMKQSGRQMLNMVMNILDVYKYEEIQMTVDKIRTSLFELSHNAIEEVDFLARQKSIEIDNMVVAGAGVLADVEIIKRVFVNMLTNAIKYTPNNGKITISSTQNTENPAYTTVRITDTGPGIPKEQIQHVFNKFTQVEARESGTVRSTGLGLTFCKMAVEAHSGRIGVKSTVGKGTTFWFTLEKTEAVEEKPVKETAKTDLSVKQQFTAAEKKLLQSYLKKLKECKVYEITTIQTILKQIDATESPNIEKWKQEISACLFVMNEEKYNRLIDLS